MAPEEDQAKPFAAADYNLHSDHEAAMFAQSKLRRKKLYIQCCGCLTVLLLIPIVVIIFILVVFHVKNPGMRMNSVSIQRQLEVDDGTTRLRGSQNMTLLVDVSVKNPNYASFKFGNATTVVYYGGVVVGEGWIPAGMVKAMKTLRTNVTVDVVPEKVSSAGSFSSDMSSGRLNMSSYTIIVGKVKMMRIIKKIMAVPLNCTFTYNVFGQAIEDNCWQRGQL